MRPGSSQLVTLSLFFFSNVVLNVLLISSSILGSLVFYNLLSNLFFLLHIPYNILSNHGAENLTFGNMFHHFSIDAILLPILQYCYYSYQCFTIYIVSYFIYYRLAVSISFALCSHFHYSQLLLHCISHYHVYLLHFISSSIITRIVICHVIILRIFHVHLSSH